MGRSTSLVNFDGVSAGTTIATGTRFGGITFTYSWQSGESLRVNDENDTNSGTNYLGASNGTGVPVDLSGTFNDFTLMPELPFSAIGLFVITTQVNPPLNADVFLRSDGVTAALTNPALGVALPDGSQVYFLGLYEDTGAAMGSVDLRADPSAFQLPYRVDGIQYAAAVPEPNFLATGCVLTLGLMCRRRRMKRG